MKTTKACVLSVFCLAGCLSSDNSLNTDTTPFSDADGIGGDSDIHVGDGDQLPGDSVGGDMSDQELEAYCLKDFVISTQDDFEALMPCATYGVSSITVSGTGMSILTIPITIIVELKIINNQNLVTISAQAVSRLMSIEIRGNPLLETIPDEIMIALRGDVTNIIVENNVSLTGTPSQPQGQLVFGGMYLQSITGSFVVTFNPLVTDLTLSMDGKNMVEYLKVANNAGLVRFNSDFVCARVAVIRENPLLDPCDIPMETAWCSCYPPDSCATEFDKEHAETCQGG